MTERGQELLAAILQGFEGDVPDGSMRRIIEASMELFAKKGLHGTKIKDIAQHADFSQGFVYNYFSTKDAIYARIVALAADGAARAVKLAAAMDGSPYERICWLTEALLCPDGLAMHHWRLIQMQAAMPGALPEDAAMAKGKAGKPLALLIPLLVDGQQRGEIVSLDPMVLAVAYFGMLQGLGILRAQGPADMPFPTVELILRFLRPEEGRANGEDLQK